MLPDPSLNPPPADKPRLAGVDGLRAIAMTLVVLGHCYLIPFGWTGVWIFYLISGYVITRGLSKEVLQGQGHWGEVYGHFLQRRFARIVPLYLIYIAINLLAARAAGSSQPFDDLPYLLSFTYNWQLIHRPIAEYGFWFPFGHLWSLSVEQQFYLVFPLLLLVLKPRHWVAGLIGGMVLAALLRLWVGVAVTDASVDPLSRSFAVYFNAACHMDAFLAGALIALLQDRLSLARAARLMLAFALAATFVYALSYIAIDHRADAPFGIGRLMNIFWGNLHGQHREVFVYLVIGAHAAWMLLMSLAQARGTRWLASPVLAHIGRISYGGYVYHGLVLWAVCGAMGWEPTRLNAISLGARVGLFVVVMALTLALAHGSFHRVEEPLRRWLSRPARGRIAAEGGKQG